MIETKKIHPNSTKFLNEDPKAEIANAEDLLDFLRDNYVNENTKITVKISDLDGNLIKTDKVILTFDEENDSIVIQNFL